MIPLRLAHEYVYHLHHVGEPARLAAALARIPVFMALCDGETRYDLLRYWAEVGDAVDIEAAYAAGLEQWRSRRHSYEETKVLITIAQLLEDVGRWEGAIAREEECLALAIERGDRSAEAQARLNLGQGCRLRGDYDRALDELTSAQSIFTRLDDRAGASAAIGNIGGVYSSRGEFDHAMECYRQDEAICRELGDRSGLSLAIGNIGIVYLSRGEYDQALECFLQKETICRELGDRIGLSSAIGNIGVMYYRRGQYDPALERYRQQEAICRELGDRVGISRAIGNRGNVHLIRGEFDQAVECFGELERISRELGDRRGESVVLGSLGVVYARRGEHERALEHFGRQELLCREIGDRSGQARAIGNRGIVSANCGEYAHALESLHHAAVEYRALGERSNLCVMLDAATGVLLDLVESESEMPVYLSTYIPTATPGAWRADALRHARAQTDECLALATELSLLEMHFNAVVCLARIDAVEGDLPAAIDHLESLSAESADDEQRAALNYWLWKISRDEGGGMRDEGREQEQQGRLLPSSARSLALQLYMQLLERSPQHEYRKRVAELEAAEVAR